MQKSVREYKNVSLQNMESLAKGFLHDFQHERIFCFDAGMGMGKTTFIQAICKNLDVISHVSSPTFSIVNEYLTKQNHLVYHFDFYRLKNLQEAVDIGIEDYFYSGCYCFIEWPKIVQKILPQNVVWIEIKENNPNTRQLTAYKKPENHGKK